MGQVIIAVDFEFCLTGHKQRQHKALPALTFTHSSDLPSPPPPPAISYRQQDIDYPACTKVISISKVSAGQTLSIQPTFSWQFLLLYLYRLWTGIKEQEPTFQKGNLGTSGTKLGLDQPKPPCYVCREGGSDSNLLVFSEEWPLVHPTDVLEDPVHLVMLCLISYGEHGAAAAGLPSLLHHLPDTQLLHLHEKKG